MQGLVNTECLISSCWQNNAQVHSLTIFEDFLYWTDRGNNQILKAKKFHGENLTVVSRYIYNLYDVHAYHPAMQPSGKN